MRDSVPTECHNAIFLCPLVGIVCVSDQTIAAKFTGAEGELPSAGTVPSLLANQHSVPVAMCAVSLPLCVKGTEREGSVVWKLGSLTHTGLWSLDKR